MIDAVAQNTKSVCASVLFYNTKRHSIIVIRRPLGNILRDVSTTTRKNRTLHRFLFIFSQIKHFLLINIMVCDIETIHHVSRWETFQTGKTCVKKITCNTKEKSFDVFFYVSCDILRLIALSPRDIAQ